MSSIPQIQLNSAWPIPQLGFGVAEIDPEGTAEAVTEALRVGYRHIDTAQMYDNERAVAEGIRASGLDRGEIFVTSKLSTACHKPEDARRAFAETLEALQSDYVDLFLIHWPLPTLYDGDFVSTWRALEDVHVEGLARTIGVSNFEVHHLQRILDECDVTPAVNQIELHPYFLNSDVRLFGEQNGIATEAWSPIAHGAVLDNPEIEAVAKETARSPAQVVLRWHIQRGTIVFPKSTSPARIEENFRIFDFEISPGQIERINALDRGDDGRMGQDPNTCVYMPN
jgi:2,5-diketo-D-gluconate reductase A